MQRWIDTHCHFDEFAAHGGMGYADAERARAAQAGVAHCVLPAVELANLQAVRAMAHRHGDSYALGIHPLYTPQAGDGDLQQLAALLEQCRPDPRPKEAAQRELAWRKASCTAQCTRQGRFHPSSTRSLAP